MRPAIASPMLSVNGKGKALPRALEHRGDESPVQPVVRPQLREGGVRLTEKRSIPAKREP